MDIKYNQNEIVDIEKETLHSSWMRNMFQMITIGIVLLTFFKTNQKLKKYFNYFIRYCCRYIFCNL